MDAEEVPPLPGFYVTHPDDFDLYKYNRTEGNPDLGHYRLLPYGNGHGFGEDAGYGYHNPGYSQTPYPEMPGGSMGVTGQDFSTEPAPQSTQGPQPVPYYDPHQGTAPPHQQFFNTDQQSIPDDTPLPPPVTGAVGRYRSNIQQTSGRKTTVIESDRRGQYGR